MIPTQSFCTTNLSVVVQVDKCVTTESELTSLCHHTMHRTHSPGRAINDTYSARTGKEEEHRLATCVGPLTSYFHNTLFLALSVYFA